MLIGAGADVHLLSRGDPPLMYAVGKGKDIGAIKAMLEAGADPLFQGESRTPLAQALARLPEGHEQIALLRTAAMKQLKGKRVSSLACKAGKKPSPTDTTRGVGIFLKDWEEHDWDWAISFVKASRSDTSQALQKMFSGSEMHAPAKEAVFDEHRPIFVVELKGMPWTIVFDEIGAHNLEGRLEEVDEAISKELGCEVLGFGRSKGLRYESGVPMESHGTDWNSEATYLERHVEDHDEDQMDRIDAEKLKQIDAWFAEKDVFLPNASFRSDGLLLKLELLGIKKKDVVGHDVVIVK